MAQPSIKEEGWLFPESHPTLKHRPHMTKRSRPTYQLELLAALFPRPARWAFFCECRYAFMKVRLSHHAVNKTS